MKRKLLLLITSLIICVIMGITSFADGDVGTWKNGKHGIWYMYKDGSYPYSCFIENESNHNVYYLDQKGYVVTSTTIFNKYQADADGVLKGVTLNDVYPSNGWKQDKSGWYYQNEDGSKPHNTLILVDGKKYWLGTDGYMLHDCYARDFGYCGSDGAFTGTINYNETVTTNQSDNASVDEQIIDSDKNLAANTLACLLDSLKDPDSLKIIKVYCQTIDINGQEVRQAVIKYSATNSYGARITSYYSAWIIPDTEKLLTDSNFKNVTRKTLSEATDKVNLDKDEILEYAKTLTDY